MLLWNRPPHDACTRCDEHKEQRQRLHTLQVALHCVKNDPDYETNEEIIAMAGGNLKAAEEMRAIEAKLEDLNKHVFWRDNQRLYTQNRETSLKAHEIVLQLDYGGFSDSANKKVSVWSASVMTPGRLMFPEHFDFFFDATNQN